MAFCVQRKPPVDQRLVPFTLNAISTVMMRPSTLDIRTNYHDGCYTFMRDTYRCWKARMESGEPSYITELFADLQQYLSRKQVRDIVFTMKNVTRAPVMATRPNILQSANDASAHPQAQHQLQNHTPIVSPDVSQPCKPHRPSSDEQLTFGEFTAIASCTKCFGRQSSFHAMRARNGDELAGSVLANRDTATDPEPSAGPEVFLGGSCNPTTWRADVAIPTLDRLGISFYNPQVSHWTPDLIELEHRAKEKAKVLFFVLDSQTRSTAGAIEVAHIAGQNSKYLLLVLLPYSSKQKILNETLSEDEYMDLMSNQLMLRQLVLRRGLPVLDSIPTALEQIKEVLLGNCCPQPPVNLASRLISLRRMFERFAADVTEAARISLVQCQQALCSLGYPENVSTLGNIQNILLCYEEVTGREMQTEHIRRGAMESVLIGFEEFCIIDACVSILMLDFYEHNCTSPIKGTNLQQPPVYLTDLQAWNMHSHPELSPFENGSAKSPRSFVLPKNGEESGATANGTTDPSTVAGPLSSRSNSSSSSSGSEPCRTLSVDADPGDEGVSKPTCPLLLAAAIEEPRAFTFDGDPFDDDEPLLGRIEPRDVYLGGSCWMKTSWRQRWAFPMLKRHNLSYYVSALHEGFCCRKSEPAGEQQQQFDPESTLRYDAAMLDACRIVIFAITNETRSLAPMTMAAHYIGLGYNVVLCVQMLSSNESSPNGHKPTLSSSAIKDYNRGRAYLIDLAKRHGIPVYESLEETFDSVINRLRNCTVRYSA
uniref:Raw n=1 Tax=Anopheles epiroticus TaxID=199890 RepID=A0A182PCJ5_9DIPT